MTAWVLFDDDAERFGPMTDLRLFAEVRTGAMTAIERFSRRFGTPRGVIGPAALERLCEERGIAGDPTVGGDGPIGLVNSRWRGPLPTSWPEIGAAQLDDRGAVVIATVDAETMLAFSRHRELPKGTRCVDAEPDRLYRRPWEILDDLPERLADDLAATSAGEPMPAEEIAADVVGAHRVSIDRRAMLGRGVVLDASDGPITVEAGVAVGHLSVLRGPLWIGPGSVVADRTQLKANTSIGPLCKVGGEIGSTIFQGHANKVHDGHLGDAWIGEWANIGAGTANSNLLNTYGEVSMRLEPDAPSERSGRTAMGCIVGDHVKFAIMVRIMTGSSFGTGSMIAATDPPRSVGRFRWLTARGESGYRLDRFLEVMRTVQARRGVVAGPAYLEHLRSLHAAGRVD